jgi:protein-disulfide isomerase
MQKRIFTLTLVVIIGILLGVAVVKKQVREPLLREILQKQQILIQNQARIEKKMEGEAGANAPADTLESLGKRIAALEGQVNVLQQQLKPGANNAAAQQMPPAEDSNEVYDIPVGWSAVRGNKNAPVTIVEFVDFQCPFCARFHEPIVQVMKAYPQDVRYILKNFPLSFHQQARPAAKAALAAGEQGKYYEMADLILENNRVLSDETFEKLAGEIGLDVKKFMDDYKNKDAQWEKIIESDMDLGRLVNVRGTPTFYLNGKKTQARDFNSLKMEIDGILKEKK